MKHLKTPLFLFIIMLIATIPFASAEIKNIGNTNYTTWNNMNNGGVVSNQFSGIGGVNTTINEGYWLIDTGYVFLSGSADAKMLIYDSNGTLLFISYQSTFFLTSYGAFVPFYFPNGCTLRDNQTIVFGIVATNYHTEYYYVSGNLYNRYYNSTNSYTDPEDPTGWSTQTNKKPCYLRVGSTSMPINMGGKDNNYGHEESEPTPTPTATESGDGGAGDRIINFTVLIIDFILGDADSLGVGFALILILGLGIIGYKLGGAWGFFAGINLGFIVCFVSALLPIWTIVVLVLLDALMFLGKLPISDNKFSLGGGD